MQRLGAVNAMALGNGSSAAMAFDGTLLTQPSAGVEQQVSDALLLSYAGIYAAPPSASVLSPNGDGADDAPRLYEDRPPVAGHHALIGPGGVTLSLPPTTRHPVSTAFTGPDRRRRERRRRTHVDVRGHGYRRPGAHVDRDGGPSRSTTRSTGSRHAPCSAACCGNDRRDRAFQLIHPATVTVTVETRAGS